MREGSKASPLKAIWILVRGYLIAICAAAAVALFLRVYVIEAFRIPTDSMAPTLVAGDNIFVDKLAYGGHLGMKERPVHRGDVVVFSFASDPSRDYIKRVIGIGGDHVEIRHEHVYLNGKDISQPEGNGLFEERLGTHDYRVEWSGATSSRRNMVLVTVPKHKIFVLGDNRAKGRDSRNWGFLGHDALRGRATIILLSIGLGQQSAPRVIRWKRFFKKID